MTLVTSHHFPGIYRRESRSHSGCGSARAGTTFNLRVLCGIPLLESSVLSGENRKSCANPSIARQRGGRKPHETQEKHGMIRSDVWCLLTEFTQSESLRKHALAVEACMRAYARKFGEDEERWGIVGLIHDFDYEKYPSAEEHPYKGNEILKERGYPDDVRRAIMSHADYTGVSRESNLEKALFACDELAGFITATALIKPNKSLAEVDAKSVRLRIYLGQRLVGLDQCRSGNETCQLVAGKQRLFQIRFSTHTRVVGVGHDGSTDVIRIATLLQDFISLV